MIRRTFATLREIDSRLKSIKNIEKITNTMRVVASTRISKTSHAMQKSREFENVCKEISSQNQTTLIPNSAHQLLIVLSSDKGLCGSVHSQLSRATRHFLKTTPSTDLVIIGNKCKFQLRRTHPENIKLSFSGIGKTVPSFPDSLLMAHEIQKLGFYNQVNLVFNKFISSMNFEPVFKEITTNKSMKPFAEFGLASSIFQGLSESHAVEVSARRNAMDNASKNATSVMQKYSTLYNRTRQSMITNELVDIITGASSLNK